MADVGGLTGDKMPSDKHETSLRFAIKTVVTEYHHIQVKVYTRMTTDYGCIPDAWVDTGDKVIVIEVGHTSADKIAKYLRDPKINEIRWYTKGMELAGLWVKDDEKPYRTRIFSDNTMRLVNKAIRHELDRQALLGDIGELEEKHRVLMKKNGLYRDDNLYVKCPYCGKTFKLSDGKTSPHGSHRILWCGGCTTNSLTE